MDLATSMHELKQIFIFLQQIECKKCSLHHEKVARHSACGPPKLSTMAEHGYERIGLCPVEQRQVNLTCAHTGIRRQLLQKLSQIPTDVIAKEVVADWQTQLKSIELAIVLLDIRKNDAEIEFADLLVQKKDKKELGQIQQKINEIIAEYHEKVEAMDELFSVIKNQIKQKL